MKFSVIIPAYNAEKFITRSLNSVLNQTYKDFEIIVVNDGSTDKTKEVVGQINDERIKVINKNNEGVSVARNTGIKNSIGDYICFLDADDEFLPNHLQHLQNLILKYPDWTFFSTAFCMTQIKDSSICIRPQVTHCVQTYKNVVKVMLNKSELIWTGCICIKKEMFNKYGLFEPGIKLGEDTDMWRRIYVHTGLVYSDNITVKRNRDGSEATKRYTRSYKADPLGRIPVFMEDITISNDVKNSLMIMHEYNKLGVVRSFLLNGEKNIAWKLLKDIDTHKIPVKRRIVTYICFLVPSGILRLIIKLKNIGVYE